MPAISCDTTQAARDKRGTEMHTCLLNAFFSSAASLFLSHKLACSQHKYTHSEETSNLERDRDEAVARAVVAEAIAARKDAQIDR